MDKISEKITDILGSTWVILLFATWMIYHNFVATQFLYVNFISDAAIELGFLILRGQNVQSRRMEKNLHQTKKDTQLDLKMSKELLHKVK